MMDDITKEFYATRLKLISAIDRLPTGAERIHFRRLADALVFLYKQYDMAKVNARVRPSIRNQANADELYAKYVTLRDDVMSSLTLAILFIT
jgi:hypothetical protein